MKNLFNAILFILLSVSVSSSMADDVIRGAFLKFADSRSVSDLAKINAVLKQSGVSLEQIDIPSSALPLVKKSLKEPLSSKDKEVLLDIFSLSKDDVVEQAVKSNRVPVIKGGGSLKTGEPDAEPYPKVYDLKAMSDADRLKARDKFGPLHVNATDAMLGVDEVMTLIAGGPWTWYFEVNGEPVELHMSKVYPGEKGWRLNYPGLTPHGAYFYADEGVAIAYITGPEKWKMRYEAPTLPDSALLGKNPFIDFTKL